MLAKPFQSILRQLQATASGWGKRDTHCGRRWFVGEARRSTWRGPAQRRIAEKASGGSVHSVFRGSRRLRPSATTLRLVGMRSGWRNTCRPIESCRRLLSSSRNGREQERRCVRANRTVSLSVYTTRWQDDRWKAEMALRTARSSRTLMWRAASSGPQDAWAVACGWRRAPHPAREASVQRTRWGRVIWNGGT